MVNFSLNNSDARTGLSFDSVFPTNVVWRTRILHPTKAYAIFPHLTPLGTNRKKRDPISPSRTMSACPGKAVALQDSIFSTLPWHHHRSLKTNTPRTLPCSQRAVLSLLKYGLPMTGAIGRNELLWSYRAIMVLSSQKWYVASTPIPH